MALLTREHLWAFKMNSVMTWGLFITKAQINKSIFFNSVLAQYLECRKSKLQTAIFNGNV